MVQSLIPRLWFARQVESTMSQAPFATSHHSAIFPLVIGCHCFPTSTRLKVVEYPFF